jgi:hypothetical protein
MIRITCSQCGASLKVKDELAGRSGRCPACKSPVKIPELAAADRDGKPASGPAPAEEPAVEDVLTPAAVAATENLAPIPFDDLPDDEPPPPIIKSGGSALGLKEDPPPEEKPAAAEKPAGEPPAEGAIDALHVPQHLGVANHYLICDHKDVVARWVNDGRGWMYRLKDGFTRATTVAGQLPQLGKFVLVEVGVERRTDGLHLKNITGYRLQDHFALMKLTKGDDAILTTIVGKAQLNDRQKTHVRSLVKSAFLPHMWPVMEQLLA